MVATVCLCLVRPGTTVTDCTGSPSMLNDEERQKHQATMKELANQA